jgi:hypothetical protein
MSTFACERGRDDDKGDDQRYERCGMGGAASHKVDFLSVGGGESTWISGVIVGTEAPSDPRTGDGRRGAGRFAVAAQPESTGKTASGPCRMPPDDRAWHTKGGRLAGRDGR